MNHISESIKVGTYFQQIIDEKITKQSEKGQKLDQLIQTFFSSIEKDIQNSYQKIFKSNQESISVQQWIHIPVEQQEAIKNIFSECSSYACLSKEWKEKDHEKIIKKLISLYAAFQLGELDRDLINIQTDLFNQTGKEKELEKEITKVFERKKLIDLLFQEQKSAFYQEKTSKKLQKIQHSLLNIEDRLQELKNQYHVLHVTQNFTVSLYDQFTFEMASDHLLYKMPEEDEEDANLQMAIQASLSELDDPQKSQNVDPKQEIIDLTTALKQQLEKEIRMNPKLVETFADTLLKLSESLNFSENTQNLLLEAEKNKKIPSSEEAGKDIKEEEVLKKEIDPEIKETTIKASYLNITQEIYSKDLKKLSQHLFSIQKTFEFSELQTYLYLIERKIENLIECKKQCLKYAEDGKETINNEINAFYLMQKFIQWKKDGKQTNQWQENVQLRKLRNETRFISLDDLELFLQIPETCFTIKNLTPPSWFKNKKVKKEGVKPIETKAEASIDETNTTLDERLYAFYSVETAE